MFIGLAFGSGHKMFTILYVLCLTALGATPSTQLHQDSPEAPKPIADKSEWQERLDITKQYILTRHKIEKTETVVLKEPSIHDLSAYTSISKVSSFTLSPSVNTIRSKRRSVSFLDSVNYILRTEKPKKYISNILPSYAYKSDYGKKETAVYMTLYDQFCRHRTYGTQATASLNKSFQVSAECQGMQHQPSLAGINSDWSTSSMSTVPYCPIQDKDDIRRMHCSEMYFFSKKRSKTRTVPDDEVPEEEGVICRSSKSTQAQSVKNSTSAQTQKKATWTCCGTTTPKAVCIKEPDKGVPDANNAAGMIGIVSHIKIGPRPSCGNGPCQGPNCIMMGYGPCSDPCAPSNCVNLNSNSAEQKVPVKVSATNNPRRGVFEIVVRRMTGAPLAKNELMLEWTPPAARPPCDVPCPLICSLPNLPAPCRPPKCKPICRTAKPCRKAPRCKFSCGPKRFRCSPCSLCGRVSCPGCPAKPCRPCRPCKPKPCSRPCPKPSKSCKPCKPCHPPFPFKPGGCTLCCTSLVPCSKPCKPCRPCKPCKSCKFPACKPCKPCFPYRPCVPDLASPASKTSIVFKPSKTKACVPCDPCTSLCGPFPSCFSCYPCIASTPYPPCLAFIPSSPCYPCNPCKSNNPGKLHERDPSIASDTCTPCNPFVTCNPCNPCEPFDSCDPCKVCKPRKPCLPYKPCKPCLPRKPCKPRRSCKPCKIRKRTYKCRPWKSCKSCKPSRLCKTCPSRSRKPCRPCSTSISKPCTPGSVSMFCSPTIPSNGRPYSLDSQDTPDSSDGKSSCNETSKTNETCSPSKGCNICTPCKPYNPKTTCNHCKPCNRVCKPFPFKPYKMFMPSRKLCRGSCCRRCKPCQLCRSSNKSGRSCKRACAIFRPRKICKPCEPCKHCVPNKRCVPSKCSKPRNPCKPGFHCKSCRLPYTPCPPYSSSASPDSCEGPGPGLESSNSIICCNPAFHQCPITRGRKG